MSYLTIYWIGVTAAFFLGVLGMALNKQRSSMPWATLLGILFMAFGWPAAVPWCYLKVHTEVKYH